MAELPERFEVLDELSRTGSKVLLRAWDKTLQREILLQIPGEGLVTRKRIHPGSQETSERPHRDRLLREARLLARVRHRGVQQLLEVLETEEGPILVLEPRTGETLADRIARDRRMSPRDVQDLGVRLAEALAAVHAAGGVHRNVSEENVVFDADGSPVLTGFEFSKPVEAILRKTSLDFRRASMGSLPVYPAPEQVAGEAADARSDLFGLGCVLYRCLTGESPLPAEIPLVFQPPKDVALLAPDAPKNLQEAIRRCLERSPMKRFQSMVELAATLSIREETPLRLEARGRPRRLWLVPVATSAAILALVFGLNAIRGGSTTRGTPLVPTDTAIQTGGFADHYEASYALLVGIDYKGSPYALANAEGDVRALAEKLEALGWRKENITLLVGAEATRRNIELALHDLESKAGRDDQVFVYYAGHGVLHTGSQKSGWAVPADAAIDVPGGEEDTKWIHFDRFDRVFRQSQAKHILVALDCCHSGAGVFRGGPSTIQNYGRRLLTEKAHFLIASSRPNQKAWDGDTHSPFAAAFLDALEEARREPVTTSQLHAAVQQKLLRLEAPQDCVMSRKDEAAPGGDFVFMRIDPAPAP